MIAIALLIGLAQAAPPTGAELQAWSSTGFEALPDAYGKSGARGVERLGADIEFADGWSLALDGGLRVLRAPSAPVEGDLFRLAATLRREMYKLTLGRHVRLDVRGFERLDGASVDFDTPGIFGASLWTGRLWNPESWDATDAMVFGGQVHLTTGGSNTARTRVDGGYEARVIDGLYHQRIHLASSTLGPRGGRILAFAELDPTKGDLESRASFQSTLPVGRTVDLGFDARWEDMTPDHAGVVRTPIEWLSPQGYSLAGMRFRWFHGGWDFTAQGSGTLRVGGVLEYGGLGRVGASFGTGDVRAGVFGTTAAIAGSWVAGGGGEVTWSPDYLTAHLDFGVYEFQGLDGVGTDVWEGRLDGRVPVYKADRDGLLSQLAIGLDGAAGTDRQLATWVRGGVTLYATVDRRRTR